MQTTTLGRTGLEVSRVCLGTWQLGGDWGAPQECEAIDAIHRARELGINFFDTAQAYGGGESERLLARGLADDLRERRDDVVIATKGGLRPEGEGIARDAGAAWLRQGAEESLRALGVDHIDLYQVHWPDPDTPAAETGELLAELVDEGKIRHVGVSNFDAAQMAELSGTVQVETLQPPYHLFRRDIEDEVLPYCRRHDVGVLVYGPLAHGLLGGRIDEETTFPDDDWRSGSDLFAGGAFHRNLEVVRELERFARERGHTVAQLAVAWTLAQPGVHVSIVGARRPDQIEGTAPAADTGLSDDDLAEVERIMQGAVAVQGPSPEGV